mmetsp:Transcript_8937/g.14899  ORF Transcript_8937/g.14899 Transcript_8937/m.14899 type:complete len:233 (+) Transcript_8937:84-782(+)|eukprot:CAMPEP_0119016268 /NCGR_PEP_ID=MMETSP1176-20130426/11907_1 /TAXON_ID=265551 /ORGANISM="Synedropsis recta cf, Strain CCMP1620" /LENGTH=232 /DNA_ID=CAMNT_0006969611 /DNA_START=54 /DNA_END=752 /DNA_ORIENTATION=-
MKATPLLSTLVLLPYAAVSAFQQVSVVPRIQRLDASFSLRSSLMEETETRTFTESDLPPVLQDIVDERNEFRLNLGRAMDVLKKDYPEILRETPDFSIYHDEITLVDPSGTQLTGLKNYKTAFSFLQTMVNFLYIPSKSTIQVRMVYDFCRSSIRISWNAVLHPKFGKPLYVDGISIYKLDAASGKITEHKIENLILNQTPVSPPYGIFSTLSQPQYGLQPAGGAWGCDGFA